MAGDVATPSVQIFKLELPARRRPDNKMSEAKGLLYLFRLNANFHPTV
jgi:hypothetical protein